MAEAGCPASESCAIRIISLRSATLERSRRSTACCSSTAPRDNISHPGEIETFHSMLLKYCTKRQHFTHGRDQDVPQHAAQVLHQETTFHTLERSRRSTACCSSTAPRDNISHTGEIKTFHSMLLKYCTKRQHFTPWRDRDVPQHAAQVVHQETTFHTRERSRRSTACCSSTAPRNNISHMGEIETFHSMLLKYCTKRQHFTHGRDQDVPQHAAQVLHQETTFHTRERSRRSTACCSSTAPRDNISLMTVGNMSCRALIE